MTKLIATPWFHQVRHVIIAGVCGLLAALAPLSQAATVTEGPDWASDVLGDAWDMSNSEDIFPLLWTHNLGSASVDAGVMTGVARDTDPHFWLLFPQIPSSILPANHRQKTIDASRYNRLSFYMWLPDTVVPGASLGRLVWHHGGDTVAAFDAAYSESPTFAVYPGWRLYQFDLATLAAARGKAWAGTIHGLRVDPCLGCAVTFKIDWARLSAAQDSTTGALAAQGATKTRLLVDQDTQSTNGNLTVIAADANGRFPLGTLPPGRYQAAAITDGDYALAERGNAWDMDSQSDLVWVARSGFAEATVTNNQFSGRTNGPVVSLLLDVPAQKPIVASKYRYLSVDMTLSSVPAQTAGLLVWWGLQTATPQFPSSYTQVVAGRRTYTVDLGTSPQWSGLIKALRIDPVSGPNAGSGVQVTIHSVRLTSTSGFVENVSYLPEGLVINARPRAVVRSPAFGTGDDYASTELGRAWDMAGRGVEQPLLGNLQGFEYTRTIADLGITGQFFHGVSRPAAPGQTEGDPQAFLVFQQNEKPVQADTYRWLGFQMHVGFDPSQQAELTKGAVARLSWKDSDSDPGVTSDDIVLMPGLATYWFDMKSLRLEPASTRTWSGTKTYLRIDPFEFPDARHFHLGPVRLLASPASRLVLPVTLDLEDADGDSLSVEVRAGSAVLARASNQKPGRLHLLANTGALAVGEHTLSVVVSDALGSRETPIDVPMTKLAAQAAPSTYEKASYERVFNWVQSLLPDLLVPVPPSSNEYACAIAGAWARFYASTNICLMAIDGAVFYTLGAGGALVYAGPLTDFLPVAAAQGF